MNPMTELRLAENPPEEGPKTTEHEASVTGRVRTNRRVASVMMLSALLNRMLESEQEKDIIDIESFLFTH